MDRSRLCGPARCRKASSQAELRNFRHRALQQKQPDHTHPLGLAGRSIGLSLQRSKMYSERRSSAAMSGSSAGSEAELEFKNEDGQTLYGTMLDAGTPDLCMLCHGLGSDRNGAFLPALAEALRKQKISTFRFDMSGNGKSEGDFKYGNYSHEAEDVRAATMKMRALGFRVVGLLGHSKAGTVVLLYASKYTDIPRVVNVSGRFEQTTGVEERFGKGIMERLEKEKTIPMEGKQPWTLTYEDLNERVNTDMAKACSQIGNRVKVLTVHGKDDGTVPVKNGELYAQHLANSELEILEGADHTYSQPEHRQALVDKVVAFLQVKVDQSTL